MKHRTFLTVAAALVVLLVGAVGVYAYDSSHDDQIADGVKAGGVDVGGMHTRPAQAKVQRALEARFQRPLEVVYHDHRFRLSAHVAHLRFDAKAMVDEALQRSRDGNAVSRTFRGVFGGSVKADVPVVASYDHGAVRRLVDRVRRNVDRPAQDARVSLASGSLRKVKAKKGLEVNLAALRREVTAAVTDPTTRQVQVHVSITKPKLTTKDLVKRYGTVIAVNRSAFRLVLYKRLKQVKSYPIAVGRQGLETPAGEYTVRDKQVNPYWHVPNSSWAGKLAGRVIPPGPQDPLKARWIGIVDGAGIHGTDDVGSLGSNASHGCIRMAIPDVIDLFDRTPYGSKIFII